MNGLLKSIQSVLIALIILALIGTGLILWFNKNTEPEETVPAVSETSSETESESVSLPEEPVETQIEETGGRHVHSYVSSVLQKPDCFRTGQMRYSCTCGDFYTESIDALDHKEGQWEVVREATKTRDGLRRKRCTRCGNVVREELISKDTVSGNSDNDASDHVHYYKSTVTKEATCTENGERTFTCECKSSYVSSIPALNHPSRETLVTDAVCGTPGSVETTCALCKAVISHDSIPALEHNWSSWKVVTNATPDAEGSEERTCSLCEEKETRPIPKTEPGVNHTHSYTSTVTTAPDCTTTGSATYTCTCGDTYTEALAALGHNPGNWVTVKEPSASEDGLREKYCRRCGIVVSSEDIPYVEPCSHNYESVITRQPTCTRSGTRTFTCSKCGDSYVSTIDPIEHKYVVIKDNAGNTIARQCNMCGEDDPTFVKPTP